MKKVLWKFLVFFGLCVAVLAAGMIFLFRFQPQILNNVLPQTQQLVKMATQYATQQAQLAALDVDKKNLQRLTQGCLSGNDCIPSLDHPKFVSARQANFMKPDDLVIAIPFEDWQREKEKSKTYAKAYPLKIMNWHEVVNDFMNGKPVVVSFSPLTMTPRVYSSSLGDSQGDNQEILNFGVSDKLLNSDVVMYDRETKSLWNQFDGMALSGPKRGQKLEVYYYPLQLVRWSDWLKLYPKTEVLSEDTGYDFDYSKSPYGDYEKNADIYFPLENTDSRRKPKELIFGIQSSGRFKAYPELELKKALPKGGMFNDEFAGRKLRVIYDKNVLTVLDNETNEYLLNAVSYYFVWAAFHPDTEIYHAPDAELSAKTQVTGQ